MPVGRLTMGKCGQEHALTHRRVGIMGRWLQGIDAVAQRTTWAVTPRVWR